MFSAVIPVAGLGTRSLPASKAIPKEMMPVFDRPIIQHVVEESINAGAADVILVTSKGKSCIEDHFDISFELESVLEKTGKSDLLTMIEELSRRVQVRTVRQKSQLGLGHAVLMAKRSVSGNAFGVLLGDDLIDSITPGLQQLIQFYESKPSKNRDFGVVMLAKVLDAEVSKYGICELESEKSMRIVRCLEKPKSSDTTSRYAILGRYFLPTLIFEVLERIPRGVIGEIQLTDALNILAESGRLYGHVLEGSRFDAGDRLGFLKANVHYYLKSPMRQDVRDYLKEILK